MSYTPINRLSMYYAELKQAEQIDLSGLEDIFPKAGELAIVRDSFGLGAVIRRHIHPDRYFLGVFDLQTGEVIAARKPASREETYLNTITLIPGFQFSCTDFMEDAEPVGGVNPLCQQIEQVPGMKRDTIDYNVGRRIVLDMVSVTDVNPCDFLGCQIY